MSGVSNVTNQLNNTNNCKTGDCSDLKNRLAKVEGDNNSQESHLANIDGKFNPLEAAIDFEKKVIETEIGIVKYLQIADFAAIESLRRDFNSNLSLQTIDEAVKADMRLEFEDWINSWSKVAYRSGVNVPDVVSSGSG